MRAVEISDASPRVHRRLRVASLVLSVLGLQLLLVTAVGDSASGDPSWGYPVQVVGVCLLWLGNVVAVIGRWRSSFAVIGLHLAFALFLLANPVISTLADIPFASAVESRGAPVALWLLALSLVGIRVGVEVIAHWRQATPVTDRRRPGLRSTRARRVLLAATLLTLAVSLASATEAYLFVRSHSYAEYYTSYSSALPAVVDVLGATSYGMVACYLAQFPRDRSYLLVLGLQLLTTLPQLAMGLRTPFMGAVVLVVAYSLLRWRLQGGVRLRVPLAVVVALLVALPAGMAGLGALSYSRFGESSTTGLDPVTDFVYSQSVSYSVVSRGVELYDRLPDHADKHYSLGPVTDYVLFGKPAQVLLGAEPLGGNTVRHATVGHEFSHAFSYYLYGQAYLDGRGSGSSYVVETYVDGGWPLVLSASLLLGALAMFLGVGYTRSWLRAAVLLVILPDVFLVARGSATGFLVPALLPHFWLAVLFTGVVRGVAARDRGRRRPAGSRHAPEREDGPDRPHGADPSGPRPARSLQPSARMASPPSGG
ncbi:O-antigen polysaccharide polymerase Wzy [Phycicoccus flavus]|uniref:O-antigen polysaccharide polymerase Wzy n=1 Tax=Phycicoccus flavus TaxID=2502783 RepID=UPI000FEBC2F0|nr:O-antigen polysaccharide polymerase Wzy [Phycicoccus flavus]NHA66684.1 O-antigen polysaccharide polymerase Wzy [Phycicoccus flavus]